MLSSLTTGSCVPLGRLRERRISWITAAREPSGPWSYGLSPNGRRQWPVPRAGWRQVQPRDDGALGGKGVAMKVCVPVTGDGQVDSRWGRARRLAVAQVDAGAITDWQEFDVGWDVLHEQGTDGAHHARVARFLREHDVQAVIAVHMGPPMRRMLNTMGLRMLPAAPGDARVVVAAVGR